MKFKSDCELIRHYFKQLLSDGKDYTIHEVLAYIIRQHGEIGINGKTINYAKVQNALFQFMRSGNSCYTMAGRGSYIKSETVAEKQISNSVTINPVCDNALWILRAAEIGVRNCFSSYHSILEMSGGGDFHLRNTEQAVATLLEQAIHQIENFREHQHSSQGQI